MTAAHLLARRALALAGVVLVSSIVFGGMLWFAPGSSAIHDQADSFPGWVVFFWTGVATWDLGPSYRGIGVVDLVAKGAARTLPMVFGALALSLSTGLVLALAFGDRLRGLGRAARALVHATSLVPVFLLGYLALVVFAVPPEGWQQTLAAVVILALGDGMLTDVVLVLDAELRELQDRDFVQSVRLRGGPVALRLAPHIALPAAQLAAGKMTFLVGGVLILEKVLGIQGIGLMGYQAAVQPDFPLLIAITVFATALVAATHLSVDVLRVMVDPRVRKDRRTEVRA
ncbi:MAG: ABC transporter permease subunit [Proteobacteria bacterium]|nr:ABC transporter permease subunit [Pseudomonadota bacterium]